MVTETTLRDLVRVVTKINDINDHPLNEPMTNQDQGFQMVKIYIYIKKGVS